MRSPYDCQKCFLCSIRRGNCRYQCIRLWRDRDGQKISGQDQKVLAGRNGIVGALTEELIDTGKESREDIAALRYTPGGAFGSCRYKLADPEKDRKEFERLLDVFRAHDIGYFFYNGGGDSADTCYKISRFSTLMGYPIQAIHVPKTIDNDLPLTDCCPGFGSVAKYIAVSTVEASFDVRSMCRTSTKIFVLEVMGRHAGWIAAAGGLAENYGIPVVILFPEVEFNEKKFLAQVENKVRRHGYCTVVVSEGCKYPNGTFLADQGARDAIRACPSGRRGTGCRQYDL